MSTIDPETEARIRAEEREAAERDIAEKCRADAERLRHRAEEEREAGFMQLSLGFSAHAARAADVAKWVSASEYPRIAASHKT